MKGLCKERGGVGCVECGGWLEGWSSEMREEAVCGGGVGM